MRLTASLVACWFPLAALAADGVWIDVGGGCQANVVKRPPPGEKVSWIGPCKDARADGLGYWVVEAKDERTLWRQVNQEGYLAGSGPGPGYSMLDGRIWRQRAGSKKWEQITSGELPAYARAFIMEGKRPRPPIQPEQAAEAARRSGDAGLKRTIEKSRIAAAGASSDPQWVQVGSSSHIDVATLSVTFGKPDVYTVFERFSGRYSRIFVTCDPFAWGPDPSRLSPLDHTVGYQVDLAREVCRRSMLAAANPVMPAYVTPPYQTLMSQGRHAESFQVAKKGADAGNAGWTRELARHYWYGLGVAQDDAEGARLYRRAAEAGDPIAMNQLGYAMQNGKGTAQDQAGAIPWLKRAAELGNGVALINLAWAYQYGHGVTQDLPLALDYANRAKARNQKNADSFVSGIQAMMNRQTEDAEDSRRRLAELEREEREERRERQRQEREEREARDRQWMDTAQALMQGAAAMKRQQDEQNARREAERRRIEADNARYRQAQAEESRRWAEQNQRLQQAALDRQRQEQERQRIEEARREEERRRQPRKQKVNLPKYSGCIRVEWDRDKPGESSRWYTLHNTCAQALGVHWCDRPGCQRSSMASNIRGGGSNRGWVLKKNGLAVSVLAACQADNGGETVYYNSAENQCWAWVTMN
jgi:TPR repeat protein